MKDASFIPPVKHIEHIFPPQVTPRMRVALCGSLQGQDDLAPAVRRAVQHLMRSMRLFQRQYGSDSGNQLAPIEQVRDLILYKRRRLCCSESKIIAKNPSSLLV